MPPSTALAVDHAVAGHAEAGDAGAGQDADVRRGAVLVVHDEPVDLSGLERRPRWTR